MRTRLALLLRARTLGALLLGGAIATAFVVVLVQHSFSSAPCAADEAGDGPPPAGATAWARLDPTQRARWPTLEYQWGLTPALTAERVFPPGVAGGGLTPYPTWEGYFRSDPAALAHNNTWLDLRSPEPPSIGGVAAAPLAGSPCG